MYVYTCTYMYCVYLGVCMSTCIYVVCVCVRVYVRVSLNVWLRVAAIWTRSCDSNLVTGDSDYVFAVEPMHWRFEDRCMG